MFDPAMFDRAQPQSGAISIDPDRAAPTVAIATERDLSELQAWLHALGEDAYGRVFIEGDRAAAGVIQAPDQVGITWLEQREQPGVALTAAVDAWLAEWLWVDATEARNLQMFTAGDATRLIGAYLNRLECRLERRWPGCSSDACPRLRD